MRGRRAGTCASLRHRVGYHVCALEMQDAINRRYLEIGIGSDQVRGVRFEGERMVLIPPPRRAGESEEYREITWERIAAE